MSGWPDGRGPASRWRDDPDGTSPLVLVLGGFLTSPPLYLPLARRLLRRGAADVVIGRVWTPDWLLAAGRGLGPNLTRAGRALVRAGERSARSTAARGAPVLVVGHSAGGMLGRLLTSPLPFQGRRLGAAPRIGALVTLGTPHHTSPSGDIGGRVGSMASAFADEVIPGAAFAPRVGYVTVASRAIVGSVGGDQRARTALRFYRGLLGQDRPSVEGDGLIPVESALLDGAVRIVLDDVVHGQFGGQPWYGSEEVIDTWWPAAVEAWHSALRIRASQGNGPAPDLSAGPVDEVSTNGV
jgi:pimeloyl-ACP methyl ester carboxylesterase